MNWDEFKTLIEGNSASENELLALLQEHTHQMRYGCEFCEDLREYENKSVTELLLDNHAKRLDSANFERELYKVFKNQTYEDLYNQSIYDEAFGFSKHANQEMFDGALEGVSCRANLEFEYLFELDDMESTLKSIIKHPLYNAEASCHTVESLARDIHNQRCLERFEECSGEFEDCIDCQGVLKNVQA